MKRYEMVKKHEDFNTIINTGKKVSNKYMIIFSKEKTFLKPNFGIAVGKKIGNAVMRNKMKRIFRNLVDNNRLLFKNYHNYIIMIKKEAINTSYQTLDEAMKKILKKEENYEK